MAVGFTELLQIMADADFFIGVLPFVITYAIFYLTLTNSPKFKENERMSALVSVVIGFFVAYFLVGHPLYQQFFTTYFATLTIGLIGIIGLFVTFALTGLHGAVTGRYWWGIPVVLIVGAAWTLSGGLAIFTPGLGYQGIGTQLVTVLNYLFNTGLIWALVIFGVVYWTMGAEEEQQGSGYGKALYDLLRTQHEPKGGGAAPDE